MSSSKKGQSMHKNTVGSKPSKGISNGASGKANNHKQEEGSLLYSISKDNYDIMDKKFNITEILPLEIKYVLKCIGGIYKNRFLYITTHKEG